MTNEPLRILILWSDNSAANLGLRVLAQGNQALLKRAFGDENIVVDCQDFGPGDSQVSFGTRSILRDIGRQNGPIKSKLREYDLVLDSGAGDSFADIYGLKRFSFIIYTHWILKRLNIPLVMGPQTVGPFNTLVGRIAALRSLRQAKLILTRDSLSAAYLSDMGISGGKTVTDVVFALPSNNMNLVRDVVINISGLLWFGNDHVSSAYYRSESMDLVRRLSSAGRKVSLLAHVVNSPNGNDDVDACRELEAQLDSDMVQEVLVPNSLDEARSFLGSAVIVVGARMHACLNAISMGRPSIPWAYSRKFEPLMKDVGWDIGFDLRTEAEIARKTTELIISSDIKNLETSLTEMRLKIDSRLSLAVEQLRETLDVNGHAGEKI